MTDTSISESFFVAGHIKKYPMDVSFRWELCKNHNTIRKKNVRNITL